MEWTVCIIHPNFTCWLALILWDSSISTLCGKLCSWNMQNIPVQRVGTPLPSFSIVPDPCYIPHRIRSLGFSTTSAALFLCNGSNTMYTKMSLLKIGSNLSAHQWRRCCLYIFTYLYIHIYIMKYCSAIKNEILALVIILMGLILSDFIYMWNLKKQSKWTENRLVVARGERVEQ